MLSKTGGLDTVKAKRKLKRAKKGKGYVQTKLHSVVVQTHHIFYNPEVTVRLWKGEHWIAHQMLRRKRISKGFIRFLEQWLADNREKAEELT